MNWKGKLIALLLWSIALGALGTGIYIAANERIENLVFTTQFAANIEKASRGKMIVLDARIRSQEGVFQTYYTNRDDNTSGSGLTDQQKEEVQLVVDNAIEWTMIHRGITVYKWSWSREDRQGNMFTYLQGACDAAHLIERNPNPNCNISERWTPLPPKNQRYS